MDVLDLRVHLTGEKQRKYLGLLLHGTPQNPFSAKRAVDEFFSEELSSGAITRKVAIKRAKDTRRFVKIALDEAGAILMSQALPNGDTGFYIIAKSSAQSPEASARQGSQTTGNSPDQVNTSLLVRTPENSATTICEDPALVEKLPAVIPLETQATEAVSPAQGYSEEEIRYEPRPEEIRSVEETRVMRTVMEAVKNRRDFTFIQVSLRDYLVSADRIQLILGQEYTRVYMAQELTGLFQSTMQKLVREAVIPKLRERWTPEDEILMENLQNLGISLQVRSIEELSRKVRQELNRMEREFVKSFPPTYNIDNQIMIPVPAPKLPNGFGGK